MESHKLVELWKNLDLPVVVYLDPGPIQFPMNVDKVSASHVVAR